MINGCRIREPSTSYAALALTLPSFSVPIAHPTSLDFVLLQHIRLRGHFPALPVFQSSCLYSTGFADAFRLFSPITVSSCFFLR
ncbi:hypothetical protein C8R45DRAFT_1108376 [Mycena sanguinolenta]|nr:hypothetical protein C8R45DRAFT_1108376 [Mycena sanguinolenta]